jgi:sialate O-acetylesterase
VSSPADNVKGNWVEASPETTEVFTAVGYFFGRDLRKSLNVPVGLINTSYGGTRIESWTSAKYLGSDFERLTKEASAAPNRIAAKDPAALYNGMIHPLIPYAMRGAIWYQGEANTSPTPYSYRNLLSNLIRNWRDDWGQGEFPFLFVQLPPYNKLPWDKAGIAWAVLRESQLVTSLTVPHTGMAVAMDHGEAENIHPKEKEPVGARLALAARAIAYGENVHYLGPALKSVSFSGDRAIVELEASGLVAKDGDLKGFAVAGDDQIFHPARATIMGLRIIASSPDVAMPIAVRYGWANFPEVNLFDSQGLPASPFRTDNFPLGTAQR